MGNVLHKDVADPRTGMTPREERLVRDSWRNFTRKNPDFGVIVFQRMFRKYPEYQKLFERFKNADVQTLPSNPKFRAHACSVGFQLSAIVESLDDPDAVAELIHRNAVNHTKHAGVRPPNFEGFFSAVLEEMEAKNKSFMTPPVVAAWVKFFEFMNTITRKVYDQADATTSSSTTKTAYKPPFLQQYQDVGHPKSSAHSKDFKGDKPAADGKSQGSAKSESASRKRAII
ncbi:cytoglobin-1-like [Haemaphysalis longicornis]